MSDKKIKKTPSNYFTHDRFFKSVFTNPIVARDFFEKNLPEYLLKIINLDTLKLEPNSFIDPALRETSSDVLFSVETDKNIAYLHLLLEQQTNPEYWMPLRICGYKVNIWKDFLKTNPGADKLPMIYAMVVYTGDKPYNTPTDFFELFHNPQSAKEMFMQPFPLLDLQKIEDKVLKEQVISGTFQFFMKHIRAREFLPYFKEALPILKQLADTGLIEYVKSVLCYTVYKAKIPNKQGFFEDLSEIFSSDNTEDIMTTLAQQFKAEGEANGKIKEKFNLAKRMMSEGFSLDLIAKITELTQPELEKFTEEHLSFS